MVAEGSEDVAVICQVGKFCRDTVASHVDPSPSRILVLEIQFKGCTLVNGEIVRYRALPQSWFETSSQF